MPEAMKVQLWSWKGQFWRAEYPDPSGSQVIPKAGVQWGMVSLQDVSILLLSPREGGYSWLCSVSLSEGPSRVIHFFCSAQLRPQDVTTSSSLY